MKVAVKYCHHENGLFLPSLKDPFQVHYCFCNTLMTCAMCQRPWISYFLLMILTQFFPHNDPNQLMEIVNMNWRNYQAGFRLISYLLTSKNQILSYLKQNKTGKNLTYIFQSMDIETDRVNQVLFVGVKLKHYCGVFGAQLIRQILSVCTCQSYFCKLMNSKIGRYYQTPNR